jgi:hypothetical protein
MFVVLPPALHDTNSRIASKKEGRGLILAVLGTLKGPILSIIFPRLCFIGFTFCQPFLISTTLAWAEKDSDSDDMNQGYGLIGAWFIVYVGIGVRSSLQTSHSSISLTLDITGDDWSVPAPDLSRHHHGTRSAHHDAV